MLIHRRKSAAPALLTKAVDDDGRLGVVQPIGSAPDLVTKEDTQLFGVGAFLLAGTAMANMVQTK